MRGDAAVAAKALRTFRRETDKLEFKGGMLDGEARRAEQIQAIARLPSRDMLYGQLVGIVASPLTGLVRGLNALIAGLAVRSARCREEGERRDPAASRPRARPSRPPRRSRGGARG